MSTSDEAMKAVIGLQQMLLKLKVEHAEQLSQLETLIATEKATSSALRSSLRAAASTQASTEDLSVHLETVVTRLFTTKFWGDLAAKADATYPAGKAQLKALVEHVARLEYGDKRISRSPVQGSNSFRGRLVGGTLVWDPLKQFDGCSTACKACKRGNIGGDSWAQPKIIHQLQGPPFLFVGRRYECRTCHATVDAEDENWRATLPRGVQTKLDVTFCGNSGVSSELLSWLVRTNTSGSTLNEFSTMYQGHRGVWLKTHEAAFLACCRDECENQMKLASQQPYTALDVSLHRPHPTVVVAEKWKKHLQDFDADLHTIRNLVTLTPQREWWRRIVQNHISGLSWFYMSYMAETDIGPEQCIMGDHTFKTAKSLRMIPDGDGQAHRPFEAIFTAFNGRGEPLVQVFCENLSYAIVRPALEDIAKRTADGPFGDDFRAGKRKLVVFVDNCCQYRKLITDTFAQYQIQVIVKLDLFHWLKRWNVNTALLRSTAGKQLFWRLKNLLSSPAKFSKDALLDALAGIRNLKCVRDLMDNNKAFEGVWQRQISHITKGCLHQLRPSEIGSDAAKLPQGTSGQESYHKNLNKFVRSSGLVSAPALANNMMSFNHRVYIRKGIMHRQHPDHHCERVDVMDLASASWNGIFNVIVQAKVDPQLVSPFAGYPLPRNTDTGALPRNFRFAGDYGAYEGSTDVIVEKIALIRDLLRLRACHENTPESMSSVLASFNDHPTASRSQYFSLIEFVNAEGNKLSLSESISRMFADDDDDDTDENDENDDHLNAFLSFAGMSADRLQCSEASFSNSLSLLAAWSHSVVVLCGPLADGLQGVAFFPPILPYSNQIYSLFVVDESARFHVGVSDAANTFEDATVAEQGAVLVSQNLPVLLPAQPRHAIGHSQVRGTQPADVERDVEVNQLNNAEVALFVWLVRRLFRELPAAKNWGGIKSELVKAYDAIMGVDVTFRKKEGGTVGPTDKVRRQRRDLLESKLRNKFDNVIVRKHWPGTTFLITHMAEVLLPPPHGQVSFDVMEVQKEALQLIEERTKDKKQPEKRARGTEGKEEEGKEEGKGDDE